MTPAAYEEVLALLLAQLHQPVQQHEDADGAVLLTSGDPGEVIVRLTAHDVLVAEFAVAWSSPYEPRIEPIPIGSIRWDGISQDAAIRAIKALLAAAREARLAKFQPCATCEQSTAPEWMREDGICRACAERDQDVVH